MNKILQTFIDGFTYNGSIKHSMINYVLILFTVLPHLPAVRSQIKGSRGRWIWTLMTTVFVQILLWFLLDVVGVSIIWCSMAGFNLLVLLKGETYNQHRKKMLIIVSLLLSSIGIVYYAVNLPPITTIAHIIAAVMGVGLFYLGKHLPGQFSSI